MTLDEIFKIALYIIGFLAVYIMKDLKSVVSDLSLSVKTVTKEINELNAKIGIVLHKTDCNEKDIEKLIRSNETIRARLHELGNIINGLQLKYHLDWAKTDKERGEL